MELYARYVILTIYEEVELNLANASVIRQKLSEAFKDNDFLMISNRKFKHTVTQEVYKKGDLANMKGLAIVSDSEEERQKAINEQRMYSKSFALFRELDDAKSWAESFFY